ncbi:MAG: zinc ribbon domain-containing protein YjdM [Bdellovibrionota bacterium]
MENNQSCPKCNSADAYFDGSLWNCPSCFHEWVLGEKQLAEEPSETKIYDAHGNVLQDGDSVTVIKDLRIKGSNSSVKVGTKVKNIKLIADSNDGHNIGCKIDGFGSMNLKSEFVKKS